MAARKDSTQGRIPLLLLVGAGKAEVGRGAVDPTQAVDLRGAVLPHFLDVLLAVSRGLLLPNGSRCFRVRDALLLHNVKIIPPRRRYPKLPSLDEQRAKRVLFLAKQWGCDGVVILVDREKLTQPDRAARLRAGRDQFRESAPGSPACAVGAACRCVETWLLADGNARRLVLGDRAGNPFSGDPEDRPPPAELKKYIRLHSESAGLEQHEAYVKLAQSARPDELRTQCRTSFPPFADDVLSEIGPLVRRAFG